MDDNTSLRRHLDELAWTPEQLAREINRSYGAGTVSAKAPYGWLKGSFPRGRVPELVAEVLTEQLERLVRVENLWPGRGDRADTRSLTRVGVDLDWKLDPQWTAALRWPVPGAPDDATQPFPGAVVASTVADWLVSDAGMPPARSAGRWLPRTVGEVALRRTSELRRYDDDAGIGSELLVDWVRHELTWVSSLARECSYDGQTGRMVYRALSELAELAGWVSREADPVAAQHFFLLALRAAGTAGDRPLGCHLVWCLAEALVRLGDADHAALLVRLARNGRADEPADGRPWVGRPDPVLVRLRDDERCRVELEPASSSAGGRRGDRADRADLVGGVRCGRDVVVG